MATFFNRATLTYGTNSISSNTVSGEILQTLTVTKTASNDVYALGDIITYAIALVNSGATNLTNLTLTDDLGRFAIDEDLSVTPLDYVLGSLLYYVNGVLQSQVTKYANNYTYIVMDNEAGLEHVARGTLPHVDTMLLISDCSRRGIQAVARIAEMIEEMNLNPGQMGLIVNRAPGGILNDGIKAEIEKHGLKLFGVLPHDEAVYDCDCNGDPSSKLPDTDPMKTALKSVMQSIGL